MSDDILARLRPAGGWKRQAERADDMAQPAAPSTPVVHQPDASQATPAPRADDERWPPPRRPRAGGHVSGGRPRRHEDRVQTALRFDRALHERLQAAADERDLSVNWLVTRAVERFLDRLLPVEEMVLTRDETPDQESSG